MTLTTEILLVVGAIVVGAIVGWILAQSKDAAVPEAERTRLVEAAREEATVMKKAAALEAEELRLKAAAEAKDIERARRAEQQKGEEELRKREEDHARKRGVLESKESELEKKEKTIVGREAAADASVRRAEELLKEAKTKLEKTAGLSADEARAQLQASVLDEARAAAAVEVKKLEDEAKTKAEEASKRILGTAIQRYASEYVAERTVSVVQLPSDDLKGRIIGREGRNIRALEAATGIDLIIDDTPEAVIISCFNPVRREIARLALSRLIADGRIHPTRIEEIVEKCEQEIDAQCKEAGEQAIFDLGLHKVHPELVLALGRLKFRASFAQNVLQHSIEVGHLAGLMAAELGLNVKMARRAGLLHDIGRSVDQESEGSHAVVGAALAKKWGEPPTVVSAIAEHENDPAPQSVLSHLVDAANLLSSQRPGARQELLASYVQRLFDLEKIAQTFPGVERAFAIQAGREVRVMVDNAQISDEQSVLLAKDIVKKIESDATYAGQVRVCVVRETRATDYAK
jgi:ribonuclease Y